MNDDLGTPGAMAVIHNHVRAGNQALERGDKAEVSRILAELRTMLGVLGLDPADPVWADAGGNDSQLEPVVDGLVKALLDQRQEARVRKDYAAADAIRDKLNELGLQIEDTPSGPRWSLN